MKAALASSAAALILACNPGPVRADTLTEAVRADLPALLSLYRDLHRHPEVSGKETKTAALLAGRMRKLGFAVTEKVGGTGVVALLKNGPGPVVMIRTDMDALPVTEKTGLPYASAVPGVMHACGHDTHMSAWIGTAQQLAGRRSDWSGTLMMIAQPAEETSDGAKDMLADGLFSRFPRPQAALAFHDSTELPAGSIGMTPGYAWANVDSVDVVVKGVGGHGAYPHNTKDPVVLASRIVLALQTIVSREVDPQDAAVVTVGRIAGGTKRNVIPDEVTLELTVRSYSDTTRRQLLDAIARIARGEAIAAGMPEDRMPVIAAREAFTPAAFNTEPLAGTISGLFRERFGKRVVEVAPTMGGEDFGRYRTAPGGEPIQSLLFRVGGVPQAQWDAAGGDLSKLPTLHSALWAPDPEPTIATALEAMTTAALHLLKK